MGIIKNIKQYNSSPGKTYPNRNIYWIVPTDNRLETALKKIRCTRNFIEHRISKIYTDKYIYISYYGGLSSSGREDDEYRWGWDNYNNDRNDFYDELEYEFGGCVNMEDYEIDVEKYNL